jgi:GYD domain
MKRGGTARRAEVQKMVESPGGRLDAFYFVFGENDVHVILDLPENLTAAAISLAVMSTGGGPHEDDRASHTRRDRSGGEKAGRLRAASDSSRELGHFAAPPGGRAYTKHIY